MRYCIIDLETTGFDHLNDHIIEIGYAIYDHDSPVPLLIESKIINCPVPIPDEIIEITGITNEMAFEFGESLEDTLTTLVNRILQHSVEFLVGHNAIKFDSKFLRAAFDRAIVKDIKFQDLPELPWLDTRFDLPLDYKPKSLSLNYMAADHGFLNPFAHRAVFDVLTCGTILSMYPVDKLVDIIKSPIVEVYAAVTYHDRSKAQKAGYNWDPDRKLWVKSLRECNLAAEMSSADFQVVRTS